MPTDFKVPLFSQGLNSIRTLQTMEAFLQNIEHTVPSLGINICSPHRIMMEYDISYTDNMIEYVGQIWDDWSGSSPRSHQKLSAKILNDTQIQLILVDDTNNDELRSFDIGPSSTLKSLFNDYAEKRGVLIFIWWQDPVHEQRRQ